MTTAARKPTAIDRIVDAYLDDYVALDPCVATAIGIKGHEVELPDLSPDGLSARSGLRRRTLAELAGATPVDATDQVTVAAATERLAVAEEIHELGLDESSLNVIESPLQDVRLVFDLMPRSTAEEWALIAKRLSNVPAALDSYIASLRTAAHREEISPRRQVEGGMAQCAENVGPEGFFAALVKEAEDLSASVRADLERGARAAEDAYARLRSVLEDELLPSAPVTDAVGRERYGVLSRSFLGSAIDLEETYLWGQREVARINALMEHTARRIRPGSSVREAMAHLNDDARYQLHGTDMLQAWMQEKSDAALFALAGSHFDIPPEIRTLECRIAPTKTGGMYYTGPSEDFSRPGRVWCSVPEGVTDFATWHELSVVYHEGVPGHHLQVAQTTCRSELLNRWRRMGCWIPGHGEGWALYAEWLMADLGFLDDPGEFLGMLDAQSLRAARVVLDIGIHCGFDAPAELGAGAWDYDKAWHFLTANSFKPEPQLRYELDRYLGWPGQAPVYKIGERLWLSLRDEAQRRAGDAFDLKAFHRRALDIGSVGMDVLRAAVLTGPADLGSTT